MVPFAIIAIRNAHWKLELDPKSILYGCAVGFSGAMGQLLLFWVLTKGPAYIIFPIICLSPVVTIILSAIFFAWDSCGSAARDFASVEAPLCRHLAGLGL
jgi:uncharacterized membrane protein